MQQRRVMHSVNCVAGCVGAAYGGGGGDEGVFQSLRTFFRAPTIWTLSASGVAGTLGVLTPRRSATGLHNELCRHTHA